MAAKLVNWLDTYMWVTCTVTFLFNEISKIMAFRTVNASYVKLLLLSVHFIKLAYNSDKIISLCKCNWKINKFVLISEIIPDKGNIKGTSDKNQSKYNVTLKSLSFTFNNSPKIIVVW
jgi:hypothetical protein